ncbi:hypothetical protein B0T19DRAFT_395085 [Cercophora scortea]|uniref:2EXR domain-containing protein n=1 Tax=Cercophora scortea TaxID=314031 RepID=A0AAE0J294_9PEZI|nr:hypothetical protein B0T19DRAFT_395085 [Cercophora scortea]
MSTSSACLQRKHSSLYVLPTTGEGCPAWSTVVRAAKHLARCYQGPEHFPGDCNIEDPEDEQLRFAQMRAARARGPAGQHWRPTENRPRAPPVFHLFSKLPQELQDMVWKATLPPAQTIRTKVYHDADSRPVVFIPANAILAFADILLYRITSRSRTLAISSHGRPQVNSFPFNPKTDTVELPMDDLVVELPNVSADDGGFFLHSRQGYFPASASVVNRFANATLSFVREDSAAPFFTFLESHERAAPTTMVANYRDVLCLLATSLPNLRTLAITMAQPDDCGYTRPVDTDYCQNILYRQYSTSSFAVYECKRLALLDAFDTLVDGNGGCPFRSLQNLAVRITNRYCSDHAMAHSPFDPLLTGEPIGRSYVKIAHGIRPALVGDDDEAWDPAVAVDEEEQDFVLDEPTLEPVRTSYARYLEKAREGALSGFGYNLQHWYEDSDVEIYEDDEGLGEDEVEHEEEDEENEEDNDQDEEEDDE